MPKLRRKKRRVYTAFGIGGARNLKSSRSAEIHDSFWTPELPPLVTPRAAEPGPGVTTFVDTENKLSIVTGTPTDTLVNPASDTAFLCNVDHHVRFELTFDGSGVNIYTRFVDVNNYGARVTFHSNGTLFLFDNDGSGAAQIGLYSANFQVAQKYVCDFAVRGTVAQVYLDGVLRITYETLSNYLTQTGGYIYHTLAVNDLVLNSYPADGEGILRCSGGLATPTWGDPAIHLGAEEEVRFKAPGDQIPHLMPPGMAAAQFIEFKDTSTIAQAGFDLNKTGDIGPARWTKNGAWLRAYAGGVHIDLQPIVADELLKLVVVNRSVTNGMFFIANGKLLWPSYDQVSAQGYSAVQTYNAPFDLYDIGFVDLAEDGYTNDFADVTASVPSPSSGQEIATPAPAHSGEATLTIGDPEQNGLPGISLFYTNDSNRLRIYNPGSLKFRIIEYVDGVANQIFNENGAYIAGESYDLKWACDSDGKLTIWKNGVRVVDAFQLDAVNYNTPLLKCANTANSTIADIVIHPHPALGIAHNHIICPQAADVADHSEESIAIEIKNVTLPTDVVVAELRFRDGGGNHISVKWNQAGNVDVEDNGTPIAGSTGVIADGQSIFVILDGNEAKLWANGVHIQDGTIVTALTGTGFECHSMQDGASCGEVNIWPANPPLPDGLK